MAFSYETVLGTEQCRGGELIGIPWLYQLSLLTPLLGLLQEQPMLWAGPRHEQAAQSPSLVPRHPGIPASLLLGGFIPYLTHNTG